MRKTSARRIYKVVIRQFEGTGDKFVNNQSAPKIAKAISTALMAGALFSCPMFSSIGVSSIGVSSIGGCSIGFFSTGFSGAAFAYGESDKIKTLRTPLISGAPNGPAGAPAQEGAPPPIGDGPTPVGVNPGMLSSPELMPWVPAIPANQIDNDFSRIPLGITPAIVSLPGVLGPSLAGVVPAPPSTPGADAGSINGSSGGYGLQAPVAQVNISPQGGMVGDAPIKRWGGQRSFDFGKPNNVRPDSSRMNDFGQRLSEKPDLKMPPQYSQDGPRQRGEYRGQTTQDLHGNRTIFRDNLRSQLTIAPY